MKKSFYNVLLYTYLVFVGITILTLIFGFYYELNNNKTFKETFIIEQKADFYAINDSLLMNKTLNSTINTNKMNEIRKFSERIIPIIIIVWAVLLKDDWIDLYNRYIKKYL
jgi:hypothetical protein